VYSGLALDKRLDSSATEACCGIRVIDLQTGDMVHWLDFDGVVDELYDVQVLTGVQRPMALGLKSDELNRVISFDDAGSTAVHTCVFAADRGATGEPRTEPADSTHETGYSYQHSLDMSLEFALTRLEPLTFPRLGMLTGAGNTNGPLAAVVAVYQGQPVGLVLAVYGSAPATARIISWCVAPEHRRKGVGSALLSRLERVLAGAGHTGLELNYRTNWVNVAAIETILQQRGWSEPQPAMLLYKGTMQDIAQADWLDRCHLPAGFELFPWSELTIAERKDILAKQEAGQWYPPELTPFQEEDRIEFLNSLGLRHQGEVVGWMITHRTAADTIQYTSLFVRQDLQPLGRALALLAEAIKRQMASDVPRGICQVRTQSERMARYMQRRFLPFDITETNQRCAHKALANEREAVPVRRTA
ncbi:MAG: GNAT family N-acetyltransferase, partial [Gammaproteobacteria bacterium]